jgi:hypothetical protein
MAKIEALTKEQERQMYQFREEWRKIALSTEPIDTIQTKESITKMYKLIGKEPPIFIFCPSLLFAQFQMAYCREVLPLIFDKKANLRANLGDKVKYEPTSFWGNMDAYWIAFYEFPEKFLGVNYKPTDSEKLKLWSILSKSCCWFWCFENYCFVSDRPTSYYWDENYRLHNTSAPAITWRDGWNLHYIHGRLIPSEIFAKCLSGDIKKKTLLKSLMKKSVLLYMKFLVRKK